MQNKIHIALGCDHAGYAYKEAVLNYLAAKGYEVTDNGTNTVDSVDYPDFVHPVAVSIQNGESKFGVIMCGSGNGVAITANKHRGIRAALCWNREIAELARQHNDANIISIPVRYVSIETAIEMLDAFLNTPFEGGRHQKRVEKIDIPM
jgi:ribose 5-phosphate isomerase B